MLINKKNNPSQMHLSIMIVTRNRRDELLRALQSCIECFLPDRTEFVIVDNASQDGTKDAVERFFQKHSIEDQYRYLSENVGPAGGRNEGLRRAKGRYIYFMDDDAHIDSREPYFFEKMINFLKENEDVFCVTTIVFDTKINEARPTIESNNYFLNKYRKVFMFHGCSFFVDKQRLFNQNGLFLNHQFWGMEELYPSLKSYFNNRFIIEMKDINVIHESSTNTRFDRGTEIILHYTGAVHVKLTFYPLVAYPLVYFMFCLRIVRHLGFRALPRSFMELAGRNTNLTKETMPFLMLMKLVKDFGFIATF